MSCFGYFSSLFGGSETVNGRSYSVVKRIGEGGFSYVDLVHREGHNYALKRLLLQLPEQCEGVEGEVRVHRAVQHPNVLRLVDWEIREEGRGGRSTARLLFPYYRNGTLQALIERSQRTGRSLSEQRILHLFLSVCLGLRAMHSCSTGPIAHRDVKPGNLLLTDTGDELVLMDLGSATEAECRITNRQEALALQELCAQTCTAPYRAPELFEVPSNCTTTAKTDVWSLGCCLYAAAFGQSPFDGSALAAVSGRITIPKTHPYSEEFCDLIGWLLQVDPASRPSVVEVEQRITSLLANEEST